MDEANEFIKNLFEKSMETFNFLKICMNSERTSIIKVHILIKINASFN